MILLVENGEILDPRRRGKGSVLSVGGKIARVGEIDPRPWYQLDVEVARIDATDCWVIPGIIDVHEHLIGGSGESGFSSQTPEITVAELLTGGITTVVGCLGVDSTTKTPSALLAKVKALREESIEAFLFSGGYDVPPSTVTGSLRGDLLYISEVIGAGEVAIADRRGSQPTLPELARVVSDAYIGGILSGKAGVTHFHVGEGKERLGPLRSLLDDYPIAPECLFPTHVERNETLMREAIALTHRGVTVDIDTVDEDLHRWLAFYFAHGGVAEKLTVSSDAGLPSPGTLFAQLRQCVRDFDFTFDRLLPLVTVNPATVLRLENKGRIAVGKDADLLIVEAGSLEIRDVVLKGRRVVGDGKMLHADKSLARSNRRIERYGGKAKID